MRGLVSWCLKIWEFRKLSEIEFNRIELLGDFFRIGEKLIPLHRIRLIKKQGEIVWNRRRTDKV